MSDEQLDESPMMVAVKLYRDCPDSVEFRLGIPGDWPAETIENGHEPPGPEWLLMTKEDLQIYKAKFQDSVDKWQNEMAILQKKEEEIENQKQLESEI